MKKLILILLFFTGFLQAQTLQNPTYGNTTTNTITVKANTESATGSNKISVQETDGKINWLQSINIPIPFTPVNYAPSTPTLGAHLGAIDTRLGQIGNTTAGITSRIYFTGDNVTVTAGTFFASSGSGKGTATSGIPTPLINGDNQKQYFAKDLISIAQPSATTAPPGNYSGQLTVTSSPTPNGTQQRYTIEIYKTNNGGTPIASGIAGAPTGNLGVTVVAILDSGLINLVAGAITNISLNGNLASTLSLATGERLRYHISAQKVGTGGGNVTMSVLYGSNYNSYYDVTVTQKASTVINDSGVVGVNVADALNTLNLKIPVNYSKVVYVNNNNPNSATIFDINNPPVTNDNSLKTNVSNLYIGLDASTWVYITSPAGYVTKTITSETSNFYLSGTTTDAGNDKNSPIYRNGAVAIGYNRTLYGRFNVINSNNGTISSSVWGTTEQTNGVNATIYNLSQTNGTIAGLKLITGDIGAGIWSIYNKRTGSNTSDFSIGNGAALSGQERFTILNNGFVGINTTSPSDQFSVNTGTNENFVVRSDSVGIKIASVNNGSTTYMPMSIDGTVIKLNTNGTTRASISTAGVFNIINLSGTGTRTVVADASGNLSATSTPPDSRPYKVYTALISQTGIAAPTSVVLENTLGGTVVLSYVSVGTYDLTLTGAFNTNKTIVFLTKQYNSSPNVILSGSYFSTNSVRILTSNNTALQDSQLSGASIEIKVYP